MPGHGFRRRCAPPPTRTARTVNDVILTAVAGTLQATLDRHGEHLPGFVIAVPGSPPRASATAENLGNRFTQTRAVVPGAGDRVQRLEHIAGIMRVRKMSAMEPWGGAVASAAVRAAVAIGVYDW